MITEFLLSILFGFVKFILSLLPNLPPMPAAITGFGDYIISVVASFSQIAVYIYGPTLFSAIVVLSIALVGFDQVYALVRFIAAKVPNINVR